MNKTTNTYNGAKSPTSARSQYRAAEVYGIIRVIGCRIAWYTNTSTWTHDINNRGQWMNRETTYQLAQAANGLLVMGTGLVDVDVEG